MAQNFNPNSSFPNNSGFPQGQAGGFQNPGTPIGGNPYGQGYTPQNPAPASANFASPAPNPNLNYNSPDQFNNIPPLDPNTQAIPTQPSQQNTSGTPNPFDNFSNQTQPSAIDFNNQNYGGFAAPGSNTFNDPYSQTGTDFQPNQVPNQAYNTPMQPETVNPYDNNLQQASFQSPDSNQVYNQPDQYPQSYSQPPSEYNSGYDQNPNQNFDYNSQPVQPADYNNGYQQQVNYNGYTDPAFQQPLGQDPNSFDKNNTFEVKKNGNKFLLIGIIAAIVILLISSLVLFVVLSARGNQNNTQTGTTSSSISSQVSSDSSLANSDSSAQNSSSQSLANSASQTNSAGGNISNGNGSFQKPSDRAKIRTATSIPADWLKQKFFNNGIDSNGNCTNLSVCGDSADPDNDNLPNIEEYNYDADPINDDIDSEGISDGDEVYIYYTHPKEKDSDGDGQGDLDELLACSDPISAISSKMNAARLDIITSNTQFKSLSQKTRQTFTNRGANATDIEKGFFQQACNVSTGGTGGNIDLGQ